LSSRKIKLRETHSKSFFLYCIVNEAILPWSVGCTTLVTLGAKKAIRIFLNYEVEKLNDSPLPTYF
jgi:hypothetical protein